MGSEKILKIFGFIVLAFLFYGIPLYYAQQVLSENFYQGGESYFKGAGHLFRENLKLGLFVSLAIQIFGTAIFAFILFLSLDTTVRTMAFKILLVIFSIILIMALFFYGKKLTYFSTDFNSFSRSLDITSAWICRILGITLSYLIVNFGEKKLKIRSTNP
ncbi:hypothetical protein [Pararhodonellum marinum]|uniref:hypothetical protein n=1 Tax=Pararhodonellum marinum TaxID=2755358 RepID=UPI00188FD7BC|nr:hypothetical protein [Pararhodonellum marinum]